MENRITISICDEEYTFVAEEAPSYMQKVGSYVNDKMSELLDAAKVGRTDAAVLTAVNITDELFKEREAGDALRRQLLQLADLGFLDQDNCRAAVDLLLRSRLTEATAFLLDYCNRRWPRETAGADTDFLDAEFAL